MAIRKPWSWAAWCLACLAAFLPAAPAVGSTPRWTTGPPYFNTSGQTVVWYTAAPLYYTDPGDLSAYVNHAAADAMVAAAANVWNVPTSLLVLAQGGALDEHVSGANVYLGTNGLVLPADVDAANYAAKQIAVLYDSDGSVTDLLLGGGASDPSGCRQHGVTESVDSIAPDGTIRHALLILNGRCTGAAPEAQLQLQYQLERMFGRLLGVGWSQLNDNVFMGTPQPTYVQALHWPIMHPIDLICGPYTYQCLPQPFTLRDDDVASITYLYPVGSSPPAGKVPSASNASLFAGELRFPTQEGVNGVNIVVQRNAVPEQILEPFEDVSAVTGIYAQRLGGNPVTPQPGGLAGSFGAVFPFFDVAGFYSLPWIPIQTGKAGQDILLHTQPINPLYTGDYSLGAYALSPVAPAGTTASWRANFVTPGWNTFYDQQVPNAPASCSPSGDGTEAAPTTLPAGGWWTGLLCGSGNASAWSFAHTSWMALPVLANRSLTVEATALDAASLGTGDKVRPVLGVWSAADALGSAPSVASQATAFNGLVLGMTTLNAQITAADTLRIAFASETGDGRPDYLYQGRVLYADTIAPATAGAGATLTLTGVGFRPGNQVQIGGVTASVTSWTGTTIVATVPRLPGVLPGTTATVDVTVTDLSTNGSTTMTGAFLYLYTPPVYVLQLVSAPAGTQIATLPASPAFVVRVLDQDGVTPLPGASVVFSVAAGSATWSACSGATCTVSTDSAGRATIGVTPSAPGAITLQATAVGQTLQASFNAVPLVRTVVATPLTSYLAAGATASWTEIAAFTQQGQVAAGTAVTWTATSSHITISSAATATDVGGLARATVTAGPLTAGTTATATVCAWTGTGCATFSAVGVDPDTYALMVTGGAAQNLHAGATFAPVTLQVTDASGNAVSGVSVQVSQVVRQWAPPCPAHGRCPPAPVRLSATTSMLSDGSGNLSVTPLAILGSETTAITVTCGRHGYASLTVRRNP